MRSCDPYGAEQRAIVPAICRDLPRRRDWWCCCWWRSAGAGPRRLAAPPTRRSAVDPVDRETAVKALGEREAVLSEAQASADASAEKIAELEQQVQALDQLLAGANADVTLLRSELLAQTAAARAAPAPGSSGGARPCRIRGGARSGSSGGAGHCRIYGGAQIRRASGGAARAGAGGRAGAADNHLQGQTAAIRLRASTGGSTRWVSSSRRTTAMRYGWSAASGTTHCREVG